MLVVGFPAGGFQTNCYLVAAGEGAPCVIIDPGQDAEAGVADAVARHRLSPVAVVLTHGHLDHTFSVVPVCDGNDIPAWIHPEDRALLSDPLLGMSRQAAAFFGDFPTREPAEVREMVDGAELDLAGLTLTVDHTPGHTRGSVTFRTATEEGGELLFAGDTLFAGSIGRTDLPGGSMAQMAESLRTKILPLPDETVVLPGHGPATTIGRERASNPFLAGVIDPAARGRGL
ncbi:MBL fold metallo-hydrolase [Actinokineospora sp. NPDC004072]